MPHLDPAVDPARWHLGPEGIAAAALTRRTALAAGRPLVVGTHGVAMTCWLTAAGHLPGPPGEFWAALRFPDIVEVRT